MTSNNLTIPNTLPFIDLTKLLGSREQSAPNNRIEGGRRDLSSDAEWFQSEQSKDEVEHMAFKGDTNYLESDEGAKEKSTFDPNDPFSIYAFRESEQTIRGTTSRTLRDVTRGFNANYPSSNYWVWDHNGGINYNTYYPVSFPSSIPRLLVKDKGLATTK